MKKLFRISLLVVFILSTQQSLFSQEKIFEESSSFSQKDDVSNGNSMNLFSNYFSDYSLINNWSIRTEMQQSITSEFNYIEMPLLFRHKVVNDFSILFGPKINVLKGLSNDEISWSSTFGMEYNLNDNTTINARFNYLMSDQFRNDSFKYNYQSGSRASYSLGSRFKF